MSFWNKIKSRFDNEPKFDSYRCKSNLKLISTRIDVIYPREVMDIKKRRKEVLALLNDKEDVKASVKAHQLIQDECKLKAIERIKDICEFLLLSYEQMNLLPLPRDTESYLHTIIYSSVYIQIQELQIIAEQLKLKFGDAFFAMALRNDMRCVDNVVLQHLGFNATYSSDILKNYIESIRLDAPIPCVWMHETEVPYPSENNVTDVPPFLDDEFHEPVKIPSYLNSNTFSRNDSCTHSQNSNINRVEDVPKDSTPWDLNTMDIPDVPSFPSDDIPDVPSFSSNDIPDVPSFSSNDIVLDFPSVPWDINHL